MDLCHSCTTLSLLYFGACLTSISPSCPPDQIQVEKDTTISIFNKSGAENQFHLHLCPLLAVQVPFSIREQITLRPLLLSQKT